MNRRTFLQSLAFAGASSVVIPEVIRPKSISIYKQTVPGSVISLSDKMLKREGRSGIYEHWYPTRMNVNSYRDILYASFYDDSYIIEERHHMRLYLSLEVMCWFHTYCIWGRDCIARGYWHTHFYNAIGYTMITIDPRMEELSWAIERYNDGKYSYVEYRIWPGRERIDTKRGPTRDAALLLAEALNRRDVPRENKLKGMALATYPCFKPRGGVEKMREALYGKSLVLQGKMSEEERLKMKTLPTDSIIFDELGLMDDG